MTNKVEKVRVPDISGATDVDVIEVFVKPGDKVSVDDPLITLEGDKASMDVPSPLAGKIKEVAVKVGDKVSENDLVLTLETEESVSEKESEKKESKPEKEEKEEKKEQADKKETKKEKEEEESKEKTKKEKEKKKKEEDQEEEKEKKEEKKEKKTIDVKVPDISGATDVDVIEVAVKKGDTIQKDDPLLTLEGDKASMDVPSPEAGTVEEVMIKEGDKVSEGDLILKLKTEESKKETAKEEEKEEKEEKEKEKKSEKAEKEEEKAEKETEEAEPEAGADIHAGPAVRRIAREFGVDLNKIKGTGAKNRIVKEDVQKFVKQQLQIAEQGGAAGLAIAAAPKIDFSKFGEIKTKPLSKIKKATGANMHRNWVTIPHVTQFGEADITDMEAFRQEQKEAAAEQGLKLTPLVFIMKVVVSALREFPIFNASLDSKGENLIYKQYFHIGVAVDTPQGLVVPVIRDVDKKGMFEMAKELKEISTKAREKGLSLNDMQGGCFTISSLGGIGGTAFTPIINAPEVAILGVSRSYQKPVYQDNGELLPRLMLPLSLSYDHRVVDGADGARFMVYLSQRLADIRTICL